MPARLALGLALLALLVGCAGSDRSESAATEGAPAPAEQGPAPAEQAPAPAEQAPAPQAVEPQPAPVEEAPPADPAPDASEAGAAPSPSNQLERTVFDWSEALNAGDNEAAADLFAPQALIIQGGVAGVLATHEDAVRWNESLPCSGQIVEIATRGEIVSAIFVLGHRKTGRCDAPPGTRAAAAFLIRGGKIVAWQQIPPPDTLEPPPETGPAPEPDPGAL